MEEEAALAVTEEEEEAEEVALSFNFRYDSNVTKGASRGRGGAPRGRGGKLFN